MAGPRYIVVRNWDRFQHYRDRRPVFIKLYTELLDNPDFGRLTHAQRSTLLGLWLMYARSRCEIVDDTAWITRQLGVRVTRATLEALNHAGFITFSASKPLASCYPRLRERERTSKVKVLSPIASYEADATQDNTNGLTTLDFDLPPHPEPDMDKDFS